MDKPQPEQPNQEVGFVISSRDFLVQLNGLPTVHINDLVESESTLGVVRAIHADQVEVLLLTKSTIVPGQIFTRSKKKLVIDVSESLLGRVIDPLGNTIDDKGKLGKKEAEYDLNTPALGINT